MYAALLRDAARLGISLDAADRPFVCWRGPTRFPSYDSWPHAEPVHEAVHASPHCGFLSTSTALTLDLRDLVVLEHTGVRACPQCLQVLPEPTLEREIAALRLLLPPLASLADRLRDLTTPLRRSARYEEGSTQCASSPWAALAAAESHLASFRRALPDTLDAPGVSRSARAAAASLEADLEPHRRGLQRYRSAAHLELAAAAVALALVTLRERCAPDPSPYSHPSLTPRERSLATLACEALRGAGALPYTRPHEAQVSPVYEGVLPPRAAAALPSAELSRIARAAARRELPRRLRPRLHQPSSSHLRLLLDECVELLARLRDEPHVWALVHTANWAPALLYDPLPLRPLLDVLVVHWRVPRLVEGCTPPLVRLPPVLAHLVSLGFARHVEIGGACRDEPAEVLLAALRLRADACTHPHSVYASALPSFAGTLELARSCFHETPPPDAVDLPG